jgi:hypothetical protein
VAVAAEFATGAWFTNDELAGAQLAQLPISWLAVAEFAQSTRRLLNGRVVVVFPGVAAQQFHAVECRIGDKDDGG